MQRLLRSLRRSLSTFSFLLRTRGRSRRPETNSPDIRVPVTASNFSPPRRRSPAPSYYVAWRTVEHARRAHDQERLRLRWFERRRRRALRLRRERLTEPARAQTNERYLRARDADPALRELNPEQRRAVLTDDDRCLVVAGAGTGKTHMLVAKIRDLIRQGRAVPHEIAVVTFTNKAAGELRERLSDLPGIEIGTIHHLARTISKQLEGTSAPLCPLADDEALRLRTFTAWLREAITAEPDLLGDAALRSAALKSVRVPPGDAPTQLLRVPPDNVVVRSAGEARIATVLWLCGIQYRYEAQFPLPEGEGDGRPYRPDFFIPDDAAADAAPSPTNGVWLEHYAFGPDGSLSPDWEETSPGAHARYRENHRWKEALHARLHTRYVATSFGDIVRCTDAGTSFAAYLAAHISPVLGRTVLPPDENRITESLERLGITDESFSALATEIDDWIRTTRQCVDPPGALRARLLKRRDADIALPLMRLADAVLKRYLEELESTATEDHEGTILRAWRLAETRGGELPWTRLLVDEWQDVNPAQSALVHALARARPARLTAVGDDWQAIYGFQGGDVALMRDFHDPTSAFAPPPARIVLTRTYRYGQRIADTARAFVLAGGRESDKTVIGYGGAPAHSLYPARIQMGALALELASPDHPARSTHPATAAVQAVLSRCAEYSGARTVLVLGRRHVDIRDVSGDPRQQIARILDGWRRRPSTLPRSLHGASRQVIREHAARIAATAGGFHHRGAFAHARRLELELSVMTIHGAKGLEADIVLLLDGARIRSNPELDPTRQSPVDALLRPDRRPDDEERRIWYVALTRARQAVYVLVPGKDGEHSPFADELWRNDDRIYDVGEDALAGILEPLRPTEPCPVCARHGRSTMALALRSGPKGDFVACTSYAWGEAHRCGHTERRCEACGDGIMARQPPPQRNAKCQNPKCGRDVPMCRCEVPKPMVLRTNHKTGSTFYGCQSYGSETSCRFTINVNPSPPSTTRSRLPSRRSSPSRWPKRRQWDQSETP